MIISKRTFEISYFILLLILLKILIGCFGGKPMMNIGGPGLEEKTTSILSKYLPGTLGKLLAERTVQLRMVFDDVKGPGVGGPGGGLSLLTASATLIDSTLVKFGLEEFEKLSEMSKEEIVDYEKKYKPAITAAMEEIWGVSKPMPPALVASSIVKGIERGKFVITAGTDARIIYLLTGHLGGLVYTVLDIVQKIARKRLQAGRKG